MICAILGGNKFQFLLIASINDDEDSERVLIKGHKTEINIKHSDGFSS